ncbi:hypothetical protein BamIOP4010DRAFT_3467 [Burkholderia ambifaria IOP40-10]|uniref:Uncharacterized protein n=2 Tax=Burkholderia ambifaria TaxID=152480 RepID=B1FHF8_9BURK|nr:hypothetical protein BamIOP4010DRAFT_3467 [Burkholderia ambifaria IOP40-10]
MNVMIAREDSISTRDDNSIHKLYYGILVNSLGAVENFRELPEKPNPRPDRRVRFSPELEFYESNPDPRTFKKKSKVLSPSEERDRVLRTLQKDYPKGKGFDAGGCGLSEFLAYATVSKIPGIRDRAEMLLQQFPEVDISKVSQNEEHEALARRLLHEILWPTGDKPAILGSSLKITEIEERLRNLKSKENYPLAKSFRDWVAARIMG